MPFFMLPVGDLGQNKKNTQQQNSHNTMKEKNYKRNYESPNVDVMSVRVESGYQTSIAQDEGNANTTRYNADSWDNTQYD